MEKLFPLVLIVLDVLAACVYGWQGDVRHAVYWLSAGVLTICVTFQKRKAMDDWGRLLRKIQHNSHKKLYRLLHPWGEKLSRISNTWRKFNYQTEGREKKKIASQKQYSSIDDRLKDCIKYSLNKRRIRGWEQTLETIRTGWRDRGRRIKGGSFS